MNPSPKASLDELLQEIKGLRSDIQELPERIATRLGRTINRELSIFFGSRVVGAFIFNWLYTHFLK